MTADLFTVALAEVKALAKAVGNIFPLSQRRESGIDFKMYTLWNGQESEKPPLHWNGGRSIMLVNKTAQF